MVFLLAFAESAIQLVPDGTIVFHILLILIMVAVLNRTLFKPINRILAEREAQTEGSLGEAQTIMAQVNETVQRYEQNLRQARGEGYQMLEKARLEALREREQKIQQLKNEITEWSEQQKAELHRQATVARQTLQQESRRLAAEIASRILQRPVS